MADTRELILSRLANVLGGVDGIAAAVRNQLDVPGIARPAAIMQDGAEAASGDQPQRFRHRFSQIQMMELRPTVELRLRADTGAEAGTLISLFRGRIVNAVCDDAALQGYVGTNGDIRFESFAQPEPAPETKEPRATFEFTFIYPLKRAALSA